MTTVSERVPFEDVCKVLEAVRRTRKNLMKVEYLTKFFDSWRKEHANVHSAHAQTDDSIYPCMRLLLPHMDKERGPYGIKEFTLARKICKHLSLVDTNEDAQKLLKYRDPGFQARAVHSADFGQLAEEVLAKRIGAKPSRQPLLVADLNGILDRIAIANEQNDPGEVNNQIGLLLRRTTGNEMKWVCRILLKNVKVGLSETAILEAYHPDASNYYDVCTDLEKVCRRLMSSSVRINDVQIELGSAFRPMLANRTPIEKVPEVMNGKDFLVEVKYDGERVQLHKDGDRYRYFSRNALEWTSSYGNSSTALAGSLTKYIHSAFKSHVSNCVLDGEMVGWFSSVGCVATKAEHFDVKKLRDGDEIQPCFIPFDCVFLNDKVLSNEPLTKRLEILDDLFEPAEGRLVRGQRKICRTEEEIVKALNTAIERREEGLIIKRPDSTYQPNTRSNQAGWIKIKPDYVDQLMDDLDLLIVGAYFGGSSKLMSHFLLALAETPESTTSNPTTFVSVCKVGSGYSVKELRDLNMRLAGHARPFSRKAPPPWLRLGREKPDVVIDPSNSQILQVKAAEIELSGQFGSKYTLRFPRVEKLREDKSWFDCMTAKEFEDLRVQTAGKLTKARAQVAHPSTSSEGNARPRRTAARAQLGEQFRAPDEKKIKKTADILSGKKICVLSGSADDSYSKQDLEKCAIELGADIVMNPGVTTSYCVGEKKIAKVQNVIRSDRYDIVRPEWLIRCRDTSTPLEFRETDMLHISTASQAAFAVPAPTEQEVTASANACSDVEDDDNENGNGSITDRSPIDEHESGSP